MNTPKTFNNAVDLKILLRGEYKQKNMAINFFGIKQPAKSKIMPVPPVPPEDLPEFPAPSGKNKLKLQDHDSVDVDELFRLNAVKKEKHDLDVHEVTRPIFLRIQTFKSALDELSQVRLKVEGSDKMLSKLESIHGEQHRALNKWRDSMKEVHEKLIFVDEMLFKRR
jgi:hypothetical protein